MGAGADESSAAFEPGTTETLAEVPSGKPASRGSAGSAAPTDARSMADALRDEEVERWRSMLRVGRAIGISMALPLPILAGDATLKIVFVAVIAIAIVHGFAFEARIRDPARYSEIHAFALSVSVVGSAFAGIFYWGVFSAAPAFIVLGIYFLARSESRWVGVAIYLLNASLQGTLASLVIFGVIEDRGIFARPEVPMRELLIEQGLIQVGYAAAFFMAMASRRVAAESLERIQRATRLAAHREALLQEAQQALDDALKIGGPGRYSERTVGSYKLGAVIGRGAMGEVYEAAHATTGDVAAVKLMHPEYLADPRAVTRFLREIAAVRALQSPHVVRVIEVSEPTDAVPYLAMEKLAGHDLAEILRERRQLPLPEVVELVRQIGSVIDVARAAGVVHRDLKPQNLFHADSAGRPLWKVLDFGVSLLAETTGTLTRGHAVGTPAYMAPEQASGEDVDYRADLYALAAVAYRSVTGHPVVSGRDVPGLLYRVVHMMPRRPGELAELPAEVDAVFMIAMAKARDARFDSGAAFADALAAAAGERLPDALRDRAVALIARHPWGAKIAA